MSIGWGETKIEDITLPFYYLYDWFSKAKNDDEKRELFVKKLNNSFFYYLRHSQPEDEEREIICKVLDVLNESVFGNKGKGGFSKLIYEQQQFETKTTKTMKQETKRDKKLNEFQKNEQFSKSLEDIDSNVDSLCKSMQRACDIHDLL